MVQFFLIIFPCVSFAQIKDERAIFINTLNFRATTIIRVPCENFEMQFKDRITINKVTAKDSITLMNKFIKTLRFSKKMKTLMSGQKCFTKEKTLLKLLYVRMAIKY